MATFLSSHLSFFGSADLIFQHAAAPELQQVSSARQGLSNARCVNGQNHHVSFEMLTVGTADKRLPTGINTTRTPLSSLQNDHEHHYHRNQQRSLQGLYLGPHWVLHRQQMG